MLNLLLPLLLAPMAVGDDATLQSASLLSYRGSVAARREDRTTAEAEKTFDWMLLVSQADGQRRQLSWAVEERGRGAWPWVERFGQLSLPDDGQPAAAAMPAIVYDRDESASVIELPLPFLTSQEPLEEGASWTAAGQRYAVQKPARLDGRDVWPIQVANNYGPKRMLWVERQSGLVIGINERVFMGMGQEYELQLRLVGQEQLDAPRKAAMEAAFTALVQLRSRLNLPGRKTALVFNAKQREILSAELPRIEAIVKDETLARIVRVGARDLELQNDRAGNVRKLLTEFEGKAAPRFELAGLTGEKLTQADLLGQVTVLHFWDYRDSPLLEPYGQTGYLDFLAQRRKNDGVKVFGVAVDGRLNEEPARGEALRGIRRLKAFMNLSYPILLDGGSLLKQLGDPRLVGAELPLFVVIGRDGKIAHYRVGHYEVDRNDGLKELNAAVSAALAK
jgi:peroxiredoxin